MKILVAVKQVPETSKVTLDEKTGTMIREGVTSIVNPLDLYAVEKALEVKETAGGEITVLSMGPPGAERAIRECLAMGCDTGVLISDRKYRGSDTWSTSYVISQAISKLGQFDLLLFGERATDGDTGQVGPGVASFLGLPVLTYVADLAIVGARVQARRLVETGYENYTAPMPVVATVVKEIAVPRLPTLRGKQSSRKAKITMWDNDRIGADGSRLGLDGSPTRVVRIIRPKVAREGTRVIVKNEQTALGAVDQIMEFLEKRGVVETE